MPDRLPNNLLDEIGRGFDPPREVTARPFGAPTRVPVTPVAMQPLAADFKATEIVAGNIVEPPALAIEPMTEDQINDKLLQIAQLLRGLTCEQMWKLTEGMHKPDGFDKELIAWAKTYMGEPVEAAPTKLTAVRRA